MPQPKLVINLLPSWGFAEYSASGPKFKDGVPKDSVMGMVHGKSPFTTVDEETAARARLDTFMIDVIIPIAVKTSALIVCEATAQGCVLSASLRRCVALQRAQWGTNLPFTVLSVTSATAHLYCNPSDNAEWRRVRDGCRAWRERDPKLLEAVHDNWGPQRLGQFWKEVKEEDPKKLESKVIKHVELEKLLAQHCQPNKRGESARQEAAKTSEQTEIQLSLKDKEVDRLWEQDGRLHKNSMDSITEESVVKVKVPAGSGYKLYYFQPVDKSKVQVGKWKLDLDPNADMLLIVDAFNERKGTIHQRGPQARLVGEISRYLGSRIPSICFQTGMTKRVTFETAEDAAADLGEAYKSTRTGSSVVFLDVRERFEQGLSTLEGNRPLNRTDIIRAAKQEFDRTCHDLFNAQLADTFDTCAMAFFHDVLSGDGDVSTTETSRKRRNSSKLLPLHVAIMLEDAHARKPLPLKWKEIVARDPTGQELPMEKDWLAKQLETRTEFSVDEIEQCGLPDEIPTDSFIRTPDGKCFHPVLSNEFHPASEKQIADTADWLAKRIAYSAWRILPEKEQQKKLKKWTSADERNDGEGGGGEKEPSSPAKQQAPGNGTHKAKGGARVTSQLEWDQDTVYQLVWKDQIAALATHMRLLFMSPNFYHINLLDVKGAKTLVDQLVRLDRIPDTNPLSGLKLLRQAWTDHDIVVHLAKHYKFWSKIMYVAQLLLAWLIVVATALGSVLCQLWAFGRRSDSPAPETEACQAAILQGIFLTSLLSSFLLFIDNLLASTKRWRQLRSGAGSLESLIWLYRARAGPFSQDKSHSAEEALQQKLDQWIDDLVSGADLSRTSLRRYKQTSTSKHARTASKPSLVERVGIAVGLSSKAEAIYCHCQYDGDLPPDAKDDHQTPVHPEQYIEMRLRPMMEFYQARLPHYTRHGMMMLGLLGLLSVSASALSYFGFANYVVISTSACTAITSYLEYADTQRKVERYSSAVNSIIKLLNWWATIDPVEQAGAQAIGQLVLGSESVIAEERLAWHPISVGYDMGNATQATEAGAKPDGEKSNAKSKATNRVELSRVHPDPGAT